MKKKILILTANPKDTLRLRLGEEVREIDQGLQRAKRRDEFELQQQWATRIQDIRRAMLDFKPNFVHFCGHGEGEAGIVFEDNTGKAHLVGAEAMEGFFRLFANDVECVLLNACYSEVQARAIAKHIDYVIGMNQRIGDKAAIEFAVAFYDALGAGESPKFAYELACNALQMANIPEHLTPVFITKNDEDDTESPSPSGPEETTEQIPNYDHLRIRNFLTNRVDLQGFCFVLQHRLKPEYAYQFLAGQTPGTKSMDMVQKAHQRGEMGELIFYLVQYWLKDIHGNPRVLSQEGMYEQLKVYHKELLERGEKDKAEQTLILLKTFGVK